jgi:hypothetical protein
VGPVAPIAASRLQSALGGWLPVFAVNAMNVSPPKVTASWMT